MSVIYLLITASFIVAMIFLGLFIWAVKSGQFKDKQTPAMRVLFDDINTNSQSSLKSKEELDADRKI